MAGTLFFFTRRARHTLLRREVRLRPLPRSSLSGRAARREAEALRGQLLAAEGRARDLAEENRALRERLGLETPGPTAREDASPPIEYSSHADAGNPAGAPMSGAATPGFEASKGADSSEDGAAPAGDLGKLGLGLGLNAPSPAETCTDLHASSGPRPGVVAMGGHTSGAVVEERGERGGAASDEKDGPSSLTAEAGMGCKEGEGDRGATSRVPILGGMSRDGAELHGAPAKGEGRAEPH